MQALSDKIGNNETAKVTFECNDCGEEFIATLTRVSETELEIENAIIGVRKSKSDFADRYVFKCPDCYEKDDYFGDECDIYSRVVGFMRPVSSWNNAKREEFKKRVVYKMPEKD